MMMNPSKFKAPAKSECMRVDEASSVLTINDEAIDAYLAGIESLANFEPLAPALLHIEAMKLCKPPSLIVILDKPYAKGLVSPIAGCMSYNASSIRYPPSTAQAFLAMCMHACKDKDMGMSESRLKSRLSASIMNSGLLAVEGLYFINAVPGYAQTDVASFKAMLLTASLIRSMIVGPYSPSGKITVYAMGTSAKHVMAMVKMQAKTKFASKVTYKRTNNPQYLFRSNESHVSTSRLGYDNMAKSKRVAKHTAKIVAKYMPEFMSEFEETIKAAPMRTFVASDELMNALTSKTSMFDVCRRVCKAVSVDQCASQFESIIKNMAGRGDKRTIKAGFEEEGRIYDELVSLMVSYSASINECKSMISTMLKVSDRTSDRIKDLHESINEAKDEAKTLVESVAKYSDKNEAAIVAKSADKFKAVVDDAYEAMADIKSVAETVSRDAVKDLDSTLAACKSVFESFSTFMSAAPIAIKARDTPMTLVMGPKIPVATMSDVNSRLCLLSTVHKRRVEFKRKDKNGSESDDESKSGSSDSSKDSSSSGSSSEGEAKRKAKAKSKTKSKAKSKAKSKSKRKHKSKDKSPDTSGSE